MQDTDTTTRQEQQERQERHAGSEANMRQGGMGRRGLIAAAAGAVAAFAVKGMADSAPVAADGAAWTMPYDSGQVSASTPLASFHNTGINSGVHGTATNYHGVTGITSAPTNSHFAGVYGSGNGVGTYGVLGFGLTDGTGVMGGTTTGVGVLGSSAGTGIGVSATNTGTGFGIYAEANNNHAIFGNLISTAAGTAGMLGKGNGAGTYGVYGLNNGGIGIYGASTTSGIGVYGAAITGYAVVGAASATSVAALYGSSTGVNTPAFAAYNAIAGGLAGTFNGKVYINGDYVATGTKSAAVPHPDGTHRLLYCVESPEAWFEDFGEGTITAGKAEVKLDPDFAAVVDTAKLHVFLTPHDSDHNLAVTNRASGGFSVSAVPSAPAHAAGRKGGDLSGSFTYRVVAKRRDVAAPRLAKYDLPKIAPPPPAPAAEKPPKT